MQRFLFLFFQMRKIKYNPPDTGIIAATEDNTFLLTQMNTPDRPCMTSDYWTMILSWFAVNEANLAVPRSQRNETTTICVDDSVTVLPEAKVKVQLL